MKYTFNKPVTVEVTHIRVEAAVRYDDEDMPNDFPFRESDMWKAVIEIDTGIIVGWPQGATGDFYMKVCDEGTYTLLDIKGNEVAKIENGYVPNGILPGDYGDYLGLDIDATGKITNWPKKPDLSAFNEEDES